jgi:transposase-like protein
MGLIKGIEGKPQGSCWLSSRVHVARHLLQTILRADQDMVTAALRPVFAVEKATQIGARWDDLASLLAERFPKAAEIMLEDKKDVLVYRRTPNNNGKCLGTQLLEQINEEIKRRSRIVEIIRNDANRLTGRSGATGAR